MRNRRLIPSVCGFPVFQKNKALKMGFENQQDKPKIANRDGNF